MAAADNYQQQINQYTNQKTQLQKKQFNIQVARLATAIAAIAATWYFFPFSSLLPVVLLILFVAAFLWLVNISLQLKTAILHCEHLIAINQNEIQIANGQYLHQPDGLAYAPPLHEYAADLDIFGRASLYQYLNRTTSQQAQQLFANWLLSPAPIPEIGQRQQATKELSASITFRQQLQALGMQQPITKATEEKLQHWAQQPNHLLQQKSWQWLRIIYPVVTISFLLAYIFNFVSSPVFYTVVFVLFLFSSWVSKQLTIYFKGIDTVVAEVTTLSQQLAAIENASFQNTYLRQWQQQLYSDNQKASAAIHQLEKILDRYDYRLNPPVFIPLNILSCWHLQVLYQLQQWRQQHATNMQQWFAVLAQMECLNSLGNIVFNHPEWSFPTIDESHHGTFITTNIGHPLITESKRVASNFNQQGLAQIAVITGSNMAGKSTFFRSVGVNMVLALMGSPVCADSMQLSPMRVISSMRIADNLEENTSTFYAELKKLKHIIDCVNRKEKVFLLLDEILRGTNSLDRHAGSEALLLQLIKQDACGMIATHDIALGELQQQLPNNLHNYHFDVQVAGEELYFDYKLKDGICTSMNASILMKKIGIEM